MRQVSLIILCPNSGYRLLNCNACFNMNPMIGFSLVIVMSCPCNWVGNGAVVSGSFALLIRLEK
jgi:hypothetical protein